MDITTVLWHLKSYPLIIIVLIGPTTNVINVIVFASKSFRSNSTSKYLIYLCIIDMIVVLSGTIPVIYSALTNFHGDIVTLSTASCAVERFVLFISGDLSIWCLMLITIDRFVAVILPMKLRSWKSNKIVAIICVGFHLLALAKNLPAFWTFAFQPANGSVAASCNLNPVLFFYETQVRAWISLCLYYLVPTFVMIACNGCVISRMYKISLKQDAANANKKQSNQSHYSKTLTKMSIAITILYLILITPAIIMWTIISLGQAGNASIGAIYAITDILVYSHHSSSFILFMISGQRFRLEVLTMLHLTNKVNPAEEGQSAINAT